MLLRGERTQGLHPRCGVGFHAESQRVLFPHDRILRRQDPLGHLGVLQQRIDRIQRRFSQWSQHHIGPFQIRHAPQMHPQRIRLGVHHAQRHSVARVAQRLSSPLGTVHEFQCDFAQAVGLGTVAPAIDGIRLQHKREHEERAQRVLAQRRERLICRDRRTEGCGADRFGSFPHHQHVTNAQPLRSGWVPRLQLFHFQTIQIGDGVQGLTGLNRVQCSSWVGGIEHSHQLHGLRNAHHITGRQRLSAPWIGLSELRQGQIIRPGNTGVRITRKNSILHLGGGKLCARRNAQRKHQEEVTHNGHRSGPFVHLFSFQPFP